MDRRDFLKCAGAAATIGALAANTAYAQENKKMNVPERNRNPYKDVDWSKVHQIHTTTHGHSTNQRMLDAYLKRGFQFLTLSNYYPSAPYCPAKDMTVNYYRVHHDHPVMVKGKLTDGPFDWNKILEPWIDEVDEQYRKSYPFKEGGPLYSNVPDDILEAPNAEHHSFPGSNGNLHLCAPGSSLATGTFDARNYYKSHSHGYHFGSGQPWRTAVDRIIEKLIYPDGGGITINHPAWTKLEYKLMLDILDYDPRVLGIEVYNQGSATATPEIVWSEPWWDHALSTGRQCFGFFVPDWGYTKGVNILLAKEKTVHECLKAYREGRWYGAIIGCGKLVFNHVNFDGNTLTAATDKPAKFQVVTKQGISLETTGLSMTFNIPEQDKQKLGYARIKAYATDGSEEILFSQPFMLTPAPKV